MQSSLLAPTMAGMAHGGVMAVIKRSATLSPHLLRAYNQVLKQFGAEYRGRTYYGAHFKCHLDDMVPRTIFYFGFWEPNNSAAIERILKPGDVFVDVGANIGYYTLLASKLVGNHGKVISVEAAPSIFAELSDNVVANGARNVRLINAAASDRPQDLTIYGGSKWNRGATSTLSGDNRAIEAIVPASPLDTLLSAEERARCALIKIDIEGGELPVLQRLLSTFDLYSPHMQILAEMATPIHGDQIRDVFNALIANGFEALQIENEYTTDWYMGWRKPVAPRPIDHLPDRQTDVLFRRRANGMSPRHETALS